MKEFHLGDVLSITTERLVSPTHMAGVYEILNFMTGDNLYTHQLPRAARECRPELLKQHPALAEAIAPADFGDDEMKVKAWLSEMVSLYGETLPVEPVPVGVHMEIGPLEELLGMTEGHKPIVVVALEDDAR